MKRSVCTHVCTRDSDGASGGSQQARGSAAPTSCPNGSRLPAGLRRSCQAAGTARACSVLVRMLPELRMGHGQGGICTNGEKNHSSSLRGSANSEPELCREPGASHRPGIQVSTAACGMIGRSYSHFGHSGVNLGSVWRSPALYPSK